MDSKGINIDNEGFYLLFQINDTFYKLTSDEKYNNFYLY